MCLLAVTVAGPLPAAASSSAAASAAPVSIELDRSSVSVSAGDRFSFRSTLRNDADRALSDLVVHLSIASTSPDVYVDPEDWSSKRSQYVRELAPGASTVLRWDVRAVGAGDLVLYVSVAPADGKLAVPGSVPLRLHVTQRRVLSVGSVLPVTLSVPAAILLLMGLAGQRRRRLR